MLPAQNKGICAKSLLLYGPIWAFSQGSGLCAGSVNQRAYLLFEVGIPTVPPQIQRKRDQILERELLCERLRTSDTTHRINWNQNERSAYNRKAI